MTMVRGSNPIWYEVDLTAHAFDDTFYMFVLDNEIPYAPLPTWQDPFGNVAWDNPIRFLANGTLPNNIYYDPDTVYRLEFRQGPTQQDPLIYLVENYVPGSSGDTPIDETSFSTDNQVSNPQFSLVNFVSPLTLNSISSQIIAVAPDWFLHLTGTGNVTLTQILLNSSVSDPSNASYALQIQLSGTWTNAYLSQRFNKNGVLWSNTFVSSSITALSGNAPQNISATLVDSQGHTLTTVLPVTSLTQTFNVYPGIGSIDSSINTDFPPIAYIEYQLLLPNNGDITLTSVQLISGDVNVEYPYEQTTIERQVDHLFHYYKDQLIQKPIPSYLIGWDFATNPAQEFGQTVAASAIGANKSKYVWDQTIVFQSANSGVGVTRGASGAIVLTAAAATQAALIQYLSAPQSIELLRSQIAANLAAYCSAAAGLKTTISLWTTTDVSLPTITTGTNNSLVLSLDANGKPATFNGNWTEIPRVNNVGNATFTVAQKGSTENFIDYMFNGWNLNGNISINSVTYFAIVIGTAAMTMGDTITIDSASLNTGSLATRPAPQSPDEVVRQCQYYYEKSYNIDVAASPAPSTVVNMFLAEQTVSQGGGNDHVIARSFYLPFKQTKRVLPNVLFNSVNGAASQVTAFLRQSGAAAGSADVTVTNWTSAGTEGLDGVSFLGNGVTNLTSITTAGTLPEGYIGLQYVLDARLGVV